MSWTAQRWAWRQRGYSSSQKPVLLCFANHANDRGYTWPGIDTIASECGLNEKTVRGAIEVILVRRGIRRAKRRVGRTGRVNLYRMPKSCWVIRPKTEVLKGGPNPVIIRAQPGSNTTNLGSVTMNHESGTQKYDDGARGSLGTPGAKEASHPSSSFLVGIEEAKKHPRWEEFATWCRSEPNGNPSPKGFRTWLNANRPKFKKRPRSKLHDLRPYEPEGWMAEKRDGFAPSILEIMKKVP